MKIREVTLSEKGFEDNDYRAMLVIEVNGREMFRFFDGEPEDANISRDFSDVQGIVSAMEQAWKAGVNGEAFDTLCDEVDERE